MILTIIKTWLTLLLALLFIIQQNLSFGQNLPDTLSLEQLIQIAQQNSLATDSVKSNFQLSTFNYQLTMARLKPQINLEAFMPNFIKTSSAITQPSGTVLFQPISNNNASLGLSIDQPIALTGGTVFLQTNLQRFDDFANDANSYNGVPFRIGIDQPLWGFNQFKWDKKLAPLRYQVAQKRFQTSNEAINSSIVNLFFNLQEAQLDLQIAANNEQNNQDLYAIAEERYELGKISQSDLLQLELSLLRASRNRESAVQSVRNATADIYNFLGKTYQGEILAARLPELKDEITIDQTSALNQARQNRPETPDWIRARQRADREVAFAKGTGGLQANLVASFGVTRSANEFSTIYTSPQQEQFVQLQLNLPIVDWGAQRNRVDIAKTQKELTEKVVSQSETTFANNIHQAVERFQTLQSQLEITNQLREKALQRFDITKESYLLGAINLRELTLSQGEKDVALREYVATLRAFWQQYYLIRQLTLYDFIHNEPIIYKQS